ncbi:glycoside hydrolase family 25 protein [Flavobacterium succinicans]|uniref:Lysozyme M1 n=1 Tax=Flavobacterium succinicans TaxID=29536 RepID=A0A199XVN0_9FLAO|nr:glycoside hydrolase family 25 protein [Flavobacterium succinicans]OAZ05384.1 lysozyme M1 precursor [Flavobacterium succinicans]
MRKVAKTYSKRRPTKKTRGLATLKKMIWAVLGLLFLGSILYHYRTAFAYYLGFKSDKISKMDVFSEARNVRVLEKHEGKTVGIDVSEYQGEISWSYVDTIENKYPLHFVFIRATAGNNVVDRRFKRNWEGAKKNKMIRGAYHYYRPNENSLEQAELFIKTVKLKTGDLPPVLDIEKLPKNQSMTNLKKGLRRWLQAIENHYKVKPIIYTGEKYYDDFLKEEFSDYLFWIANYNFYREEIQDDWLFWQFTERAAVPGIEENVDVNIYNGDLQQLQFITVE